MKIHVPEKCYEELVYALELISDLTQIALLLVFASHNTVEVLEQFAQQNMTYNFNLQFNTCIFHLCNVTSNQ